MIKNKYILSFIALLFLSLCIRTALSSTIPVGTKPSAVGVNHITNRIYVTNADSDSVSVIDGRNDKVINTIFVGKNPRAVVANSKTNTIYVTNLGSKNISVINGSTNQVKTVSVGDYPASIGVNAITNRIYVANSGNNNISIIDGLTNKVIDKVEVGNVPSGIAVDTYM